MPSSPAWEGHGRLPGRGLGSGTTATLGALTYFKNTMCEVKRSKAKAERITNTHHDKLLYS